MNNVSISDKSIIFEISSGYIYLRTYVISQNTIGPLLSESIRGVIEYLSSQFPIMSLKYIGGCLHLIVGQHLKAKPFEYSLIERDFDSHIKYIQPADLDIIGCSNYNAAEIDTHLRKLMLGDNGGRISQTYYLYDLEVSDYHVNILKMVKELQGVTIIFSTTSLLAQTYHLSLQLMEETSEKLLQKEKILVRNLKNSPYISGKLTVRSEKEVKKTPGLHHLGLAGPSVSPNQFFNILSLLPSIMTVPQKRESYPVLPRIDPIPISRREDLSTSNEKRTEIKLDQSVEAYFEKYDWSLSISETDIICYNEIFELILDANPDNSNARNRITIFGTKYNFT